jgi:hypothetical protein
MPRVQRIADYGCAGIVLALGIVRIVITEMLHPPSAVLDTPLLWILLAMLNLLRLRNGYSVKGLRVFCIGANVSVLALEAVRFKMFGPSALIAAVPILAETLFSVIRSSQTATDL